MPTFSRRPGNLARLTRIPVTGEFIVRLWVLLCLPLAILGCAASLNEAATFPPKYYPSGPEPRTVPACAGPITVTATDGREGFTEAGRRFEEQKPASDYPIKMTGDAVAYVRVPLTEFSSGPAIPGPDTRRPPSQSRSTICTSKRRRS